MNGRLEITFVKIRNNLVSTPIFTSSDFSVPLILQTDESDCSIGALLTEKFENMETVIWY